MSASVARFRLIRTPQSTKAKHAAALRRAERMETKAREAKADALAAKVRRLAVEQPWQADAVGRIVEHLLDTQPD